MELSSPRLMTLELTMVKEEEDLEILRQVERRRAKEQVEGEGGKVKLERARASRSCWTRRHNTSCGSNEAMTDSTAKSLEWRIDYVSLGSRFDYVTRALSSIRSTSNHRRQRFSSLCTSGRNS